MIRGQPRGNLLVMKKNNKTIFDRALARAQQETAKVFDTIRKERDYTEKESKILIKEIGQRIVPLNEQQQTINDLLKETTDKKQRLELLEQYHEVNSDIQKYWKNKNAEWEKKEKNKT